MNRPKALICFLCGQGFGTASLSIHQPQCYKKKLAQWEIGDPATRGPRPVNPATRVSPNKSPKGKKMTAADVDKFNEEQFGGYTESLSPCPHCGRRFAAQSLQVHLRSCRPGNTARPVGSPVGGPRQETHSRSGSPVDQSADESASGLVPCANCGRRFAPDRVKKHEAACRGMRQRRTYDAHKHRVEGTEMEGMRMPKATPKAASSGWREKHEEFQKAIKYSRMVQRAQAQGQSLASLPPPPPSANPDYVPCPHCGRRFNPTAAERHIPRCATTVNKPKPPPGLRPPSPASPMRPASPGGRHKSPTASPVPKRSPAASPRAAATRSPAKSPVHKSSPARGRATAAPSTPTHATDASRHLALPPSGPPSAPASPGGSKFCHECGTRFPLESSKFCSECGTKRL